MPKARKGFEFARYRKGSTSTRRIGLAIQQVWADVIEDPQDRARAESLLGLTPGSLSSSSSAPYEVEVEGSGLTGAEALVLVILWDFAKDLGYDVAKDATREMLVRGAKTLWDGLVKKRVIAILPAKPIGKEIHLSDDVQ